MTSSSPKRSGSEQLAVAVAAQFLPGDLTSSRALPREAMGTIAWRAALDTLTRHCLTGLGVHLAERGDLALSARQREELYECHRVVLTRVLWLERVVVETVDLLEGSGIDVRVLKGASLAHTVYPDPQLRQYVDVDLLVRVDQFDDAVDTLVGAGGRRRHEEPRPGFVSRFGKSVELLRLDGTSLDLHCSLACGVHAVRVRNPDLFASASPFQVAGRELYGLGPAERFLHACYHATVGNRADKVGPYLDVILALDSPDLDLDRVGWLRERWQAEAVTAAGVMRAWEVLGVEGDRPLLGWARGHRASVAESRLARAGTDDGAGTLAEAAAMLRVIPGVMSKAAYIAGLLVPSRAYRVERGQSLTGRFTALLHRVRGATPGRR